MEPVGASPEEAVESCLLRIAEREPVVRAWAHLDPAEARAGARAIAGAVAESPLHGVPVGVKDVIDTAEMPTSYGSPLYRGHRPGQDAACVALLRRAGAIVIGKTTTTEFALYSPSATTNPHDPERTPGGSSSGSAAAVAAGMVPLALGTQTAGSTVRPASFCGVFGFKPSWGWTALEGVKQLSHPLDTLGLFARDVHHLRIAFDALAIRAVTGDPAVPARPRLAFVRTPWWGELDPSGSAALERAAGLLADAGAAVDEVDLSDVLDGLVEAQNRLMEHDVARALAPELERAPDLLSAQLRSLIERGQSVDDADAVGVTELARARRGLLGLPSRRVRCRPHPRDRRRSSGWPRCDGRSSVLPRLDPARDACACRPGARRRRRPAHRRAARRAAGDRPEAARNRRVGRCRARRAGYSVGGAPLGHIRHAQREMIVAVDIETAGITLEEQDDFGSLKVVGRGDPSVQLLADALGSSGRARRRARLPGRERPRELGGAPRRGLEHPISRDARRRRALRLVRPDHGRGSSAPRVGVGAAAPRWRIVVISMVLPLVEQLVPLLRALGHEPVAWLIARRPPGWRLPPWGEIGDSSAPQGLSVLFAADKWAVEPLLRGLEPDLALCAGFPWKLPQAAVEVPQLGSINQHPALLPRHRGPVPLAWALREDDPTFGVTWHRMDAELDTGPILAQGAVPIEDDDCTIDEVGPKVSRLSFDLLPHALARIAAGDPGDPQPGAGASWAGHFGADYASVDWSQPTRAIHNQVRAWRLTFGLSPVQGPIAQLDGKPVKLLRTSLTDPGAGARRSRLRRRTVVDRRVGAGRSYRRALTSTSVRGTDSCPRTRYGASRASTSSTTAARSRASRVAPIRPK